MVFVYLGEGVKVALTLKQGISISPRGGIVVDKIPKLSCGVCLVGVLEMSILGFSSGRDIGTKSYMGQVLEKPMFKILRDVYAVPIQSYFFSEEVPSWLPDTV